MSSANFVEMTTSAVKVLTDGSLSSDQIWISPISPCQDPTDHQFTAFLKPEATAISAGVKFTPLFEALLEIFSTHKVEVGAIRVVSGSFFERTGIMARHYGVINAISRLGEAALSENALSMLHERFGEELSSGYELMGGQQFLQEYQKFSPFALSILFDNLGSIRLAPGTYACLVTVEGRRLILLNGFHPYQLERFTRPTAVTVLLECRTTTPWKSLRKKVAGATNPAKALPGSFRQVLLERADEFGLVEVGQNANGIHLSAGPLEGMVEVQRFFGTDDNSDLSVETTCFGKLLNTADLPENLIEQLSDNASFEVDGQMISAFDLTEELDVTDAILALRKLS
ncbi:MAG: hypothetical protein ACRDRI_20385 [Pseudonocardiaceae bacterium]